MHSYAITIQAPIERTWLFLTEAKFLARWMVDEDAQLLVQTTWEANSPIRFIGRMHGVSFENDGVVLYIEPSARLRYTHRSSLSKLDNSEANYVILDFALESCEDGSQLTLHLSNFPTTEIEKHLMLYWPATLRVLKRAVEQHSD